MNFTPLCVARVSQVESPSTNFRFRPLPSANLSILSSGESLPLTLSKSPAVL